MYDWFTHKTGVSLAQLSRLKNWSIVFQVIAFLTLIAKGVPLEQQLFVRIFVSLIFFGLAMTRQFYHSTSSHWQLSTTVRYVRECPLVFCDSIIGLLL